MQPDWTVLLIGGSSATGKSYLARQLALHYKIPLMEVDDIRIAIQQIADRERHADLFFFLDHPDYLQANDPFPLVKKLISVAKETWPALNELISKHLICNEPAIFEGDGILPEILVQRDLHQLKTIFLVDTKEHLLATDIQRYRGRGRGTYNGENADKQAEFSFRFGQELEKQAAFYHFSVVKTAPLETLYTRVLAVLES